jgi:hypothetical protein
MRLLPQAMPLTATSEYAPIICAPVILRPLEDSVPIFALMLVTPSCANFLSVLVPLYSNIGAAHQRGSQVIPTVVQMLERPPILALAMCIFLRVVETVVGIFGRVLNSGEIS